MATKYRQALRRSWTNNCFEQLNCNCRSNNYQLNRSRQLKCLLSFIHWNMGRFSIVEFEDGIQLIPTSWIFSDNKKCYWPYYKKQEKINQAIFNEEHPDIDKWSSYDILRIFGTADTYTNGMRKLKLAEQISDIESGKDDIDKKMCRRNRAKRRFTSSSEEEDFENEATEEEDFEEKSRTTQEICKKKPSKIPPLPTLPIVKQTQTLPEKKKKIFDNQTNNTDIHSSLYNFNKYSTKESFSSVQSDISCTGKQSTSSCKTDFQTEILRKLNIIIHQVKMVDKRLEIHEEQCRFSLHRREDNILQDEEIGLPLHNELALDILESKLKNKEFFESMVYTLKGLGGFDVHSCTINLLKKLITNPLAEMYSMAGAKKKKAFQDLILYKIILKTVRVHYKDTTETEIAQIIAKWLVQAKARRERKKCRYIEENIDKATSSSSHNS